MLKHKEEKLLRLIEISTEFLNSTVDQLNYQKISDDMLVLSGAKHVSLTLKEPEQTDFKTVASSGVEVRPKIEPLIIHMTIDQEPIGHFVLTVENDLTLDNHHITQLYANQVALLMGRIRARQKCKKNTNRLEDIIQAVNVGTWEWNIQEGTTLFNERWANIIGYTLEELLPINIKKWIEFLHPQDRQKMEGKLQDVFHKKDIYYAMKYRIKHKDGSWRNVLDQGKVVSWTKEGKPLLMIGTHLDITESEKLKDEHERFFAISTDLLCVVDMAGNLISVNHSWEKQLGYPVSYLKSQNFLDFVHPDDIEATKERMSELSQDKAVSNFVNRYRYKDGSYHYIEWLSQPYDNIIYGSGRDITEKYEKQQEVEFLSFRDYVTGLYNRRYMEDAIERLDTKSNLPLAVMVVDINGLKLANDAFGHEMGDKLIKSVADIIKKTCRSDDIVGRVGGDEFLILLPNTNYRQAKRIQDRMIKEASHVREDALIVSFALGCAVKTNLSQDIREVEKTADKNMYRHKSKYGKLMRNETIETALSKVFKADDTERIHAEQVSLYCEQIAEAMGLPPNEIEDAKLSGVLHDIGKITMPESISANKDKLQKADWEEIRRHPITGYNILKGADEYAHLAEGILHHHERIDGKGYPAGLKKDKIPLLSKIIAVADAYEAMTAGRPYKKAKTQEEAIKELRKYSASQFDSEIVEVFINKVIN